MKINSLIFGVVMFVATTGVALACGSSNTYSGSGSAGLWTTQTQFGGKFNSSASSGTSGGSQASTGVNGNGWSFQTTQNAGYGYAGAGGKVTSGGVTTWTTGGSKSTGSSFGVDGGNLHGFNNNTAGGVATNYTSAASGSMKSFTSGSDWGVGGFATVTFGSSHKGNHGHNNGF